MNDVRSPYSGTSPVASLAASEGGVTLVEGQSFCVSGRSGDMRPEFPHGLFVFDTRVLSRWELWLNGHRLEPLTVDVRSPFSASFLARSTPEEGHADADVVVFRHRDVGQGLRERIVVTNHGLRPATTSLELRCDVDFAGLFEVKESRVELRGEHRRDVVGSSMRFVQRYGGVEKQVTIRSAPGATVEPESFTWTEVLAAGGSWEVCVQVSAALNGTPIVPRFDCDAHDAEAVPARRLQTWRATLPDIVTDHLPLAETLHRSGEDLGALRIFDPDHPELPILAAGAPWFMTVFGRDSLLTAWMTLMADSSLAHGVLETLARFQGEDVNHATEEQPGKILHEMRFGAASGLALGGGDVYYGSIDATPLFVMLLGELRRWDDRDVLVERLLPHADRALEWIEEFGDRDGDGYVEYERHDERGLANQGWKDSWDAMRHGDGRLARTPIALCEVQGYVYAAYVARAHLAVEAGDDATARRYVERARDLRRRFNEDFWVDELGGFALGLDADKKPIDALGSNIGHCLWTGIIEPERAGLVAETLLADDSFSGFGVRTLSASMRAYNPVSYHNGSVWPHDNAICAAGLARYGFVEQANRIVSAQIDVARSHHGRLPELFAGFGRDELSVPAAYPASCSPQAWAAASPLLWLRTMLRLDPHAPERVVRLSPHLPDGISRLRVSGVTIAGERLSITVEGDQVEVEGAGALEVRHEAGPALTPLVPG